MIRKYLNERKSRKEICIVGRSLHERGAVAANDGNISVKLNENEFLITPTNVSKGFMKPNMIVKTNKNGEVIKGKLKVSSEFMMHLRVYKENKSVNAVVHAHPPYATSFAVAGEAIDKALLTEAVVLLGKVPCAEYALPGTADVGNSIAEYCEGYNAVLLKNHGVLTWGIDLKQAFFRMEAVENYAKVSVFSDKYFNSKGRMSKSQIDGLLDLRGKMGIKTGDIPIGEE